MHAFRKLRLLGKGSFGSVYKVVRQRGRRRTYAMKCVRLQQLSRRERRDALQEVRFMAALRHPHIVRFYEAFRHADMLVMVDGTCH